jgi:hypothetical protein
MTSDDVKSDKSGKRDGGRELSPEQAAAAAMVAEAKKRGLELSARMGVGCHNSSTAPDLAIYAQRSCSYASCIC